MLKSMGGIEEQVIKRVELEGILQRVSELEKDSERFKTFEKEMNQIKKEMLQTKELLKKLHLSQNGGQNHTLASRSATGNVSIHLPEEHEMSSYRHIDFN